MITICNKNYLTGKHTEMQAAVKIWAVQKPVMAPTACYIPVDTLPLESKNV
jgi:hypothetical protein